MNDIKTTSTSTNIPLNKLGPPGTTTMLFVVPQFKHSKLTDEQRLKDQTIRMFKVTCRLSRTPELEREVHFNFKHDAGDSLFVVDDNIAQLRINLNNEVFDFYCNSKKRLSTIEYKCLADSLDHAKRKFQTYVFPFVDHISYIASAPIHIVQISIFDETHQITRTDINVAYPDKVINPGSSNIKKFLTPVYAMYREAKNSSSVFYHFFCLFKILEGLLGHMNSAIRKEAHNKGITLPPLNRKMPNFKGIRDDQLKYVGKSVKYIYDDYLSRNFRQSIAHFVTDEGNILYASDLDLSDRFSNAIQITDISCRIMIEYFEQCLSVLENSPKN